MKEWIDVWINEWMRVRKNNGLIDGKEEWVSEWTEVRKNEEWMDERKKE